MRKTTKNKQLKNFLKLKWILKFVKAIKKIAFLKTCHLLVK